MVTVALEALPDALALSTLDRMQKKTAVLALSGLLALTACSSGSPTNNTTTASAPDGSSAASPTRSSSGNPTEQTGSSLAASSEGVSGAQSESFAMPSEIGKVLQAAQDDVQRISGNPIYISHSDDALGKGRHQVVDSNWKVCSQSPAAGTTVSDGVDVRFQVVKLQESCP